MPWLQLSDGQKLNIILRYFGSFSCNRFLKSRRHCVNEIMCGTSYCCHSLFTPAVYDWVNLVGLRSLTNFMLSTALKSLQQIFSMICCIQFISRFDKNDLRSSCRSDYDPSHYFRLKIASCIRTNNQIHVSYCKQRSKRNLMFIPIA